MNALIVIKNAWKNLLYSILSPEISALIQLLSIMYVDGSHCAGTFSSH